jgi:hypothetical protein
MTPWMHPLLPPIKVPAGCAAQEANLFNLPLTFSLDESSPDINQWRTFNFVYCQQVRPQQSHTHQRGTVCSIGISSVPSPQ